MNNLPNEEKDLFIRKKLREDELVSKKYDDVFENFLKGDHEMKEEPRIESKDEKSKKQKKSWVKPFAAVAACTLIVTGANVYATTQGYDNIFFMIRDLRKDKTQTSTVITNKEDLLVDSDTTISYTNIQVADGLFMQINRLVVQNGKATLHMSVNQEKSNNRPSRFIVSYEGEELGRTAIEKNPYETQYTCVIELNNYKTNMEVLQLKIEDYDYNEIATIEINLKEKELNLLGKEENADEEVKKISEIDLKKKLGIYSILTSPYDYDKDFKYFCLAIGVLSDGQYSQYVTQDDEGYYTYLRDSVNGVLKEAVGEELGTKINSKYFKYDAKIDGYKFADAGDGSFDGLVLNIDDLKYEAGKYTVTFTYCIPSNGDYEAGNIEKLDRYQGTYTFTLNGEHAQYTRYKIENTEMKKVSENKTTVEEDKTKTEETSNTQDKNHEHQYSVVKAETTGDYHTTFDGKHTLKCSICGEEKQEPHNFDKWYSIYNGTAWTLWCKDCNQYIYTTDYSVVENSGYPEDLPDSNDTETTNETNNNMEEYVSGILDKPEIPQYDPSKVNNYASTMNWTEHWAPGLKFQYPTEWAFSDKSYENWRGWTVNAEAIGWAIGKDPDTKEIIESLMEIRVFEQEIVEDAENEEDAYNQITEKLHLTGNGYGFGYTTENNQKWSTCYYFSNMNGIDKHSEFYIHLSKLSGTKSYIVDIVEIYASNSNNYKVTNITNKVIGSLKTTSK